MNAAQIRPEDSRLARLRILATSSIVGADIAWLLGEYDRLQRLINTPHTHDFLEGVRLEMPHQRERWGSEHDAGKTPAEWFWLVGTSQARRSCLS